MSNTSSRLSYQDCFSFFDEALKDKIGGRYLCDNWKHATWMRKRMFHARKLDRKDNCDIYPDPGEPLHGRSVYDVLQLQLRQDKEDNWWIYAIKNQLDMNRVELLGGSEDVLMVESSEDEEPETLWECKP